MDGYKRIPTAAGSLGEALALGRAFWQLTKPRVVALLVLTAWVGMMLATTGLPDAMKLSMDYFAGLRARPIDADASAV